MTNHYNVKIWVTYEDYWVNHQSNGEPNHSHYYGPMLEAAKSKAKSAIEDGKMFTSKVVTTDGDLVVMYANCGNGRVGWIEGSDS